MTFLRRRNHENVKEKENSKRKKKKWHRWGNVNEGFTHRCSIDQRSADRRASKNKSTWSKITRLGKQADEQNQTLEREQNQPQKIQGKWNKREKAAKTSIQKQAGENLRQGETAGWKVTIDKSGGSREYELDTASAPQCCRKQSRADTCLSPLTPVFFSRCSQGGVCTHILYIHISPLCM